MKILPTLLLTLVAGASLSTPTSAATLTYNVSVNTSGLSGGQIVADLLCLGVCRSVEATILNFSPTGSLGGTTGSLFGAPVGNFNTTLKESNNSGGDDFFQTYTFGNTFSFRLILSGAGLDPGPNTFDATTFTLSLYNTAGDTPVVDPALQINISGGGTVGTAITDARVTASLVPEPSTYLLLGSALTLLTCVRLRRLS